MWGLVFFNKFEMFSPKTISWKIVSSPYLPPLLVLPLCIMLLYLMRFHIPLIPCLCSFILILYFLCFLDCIISMDVFLCSLILLPVLIYCSIPLINFLFQLCFSTPEFPLVLFYNLYPFIDILCVMQCDSHTFFFLFNYDFL